MASEFSRCAALAALLLTGACRSASTGTSSVPADAERDPIVAAQTADIADFPAGQLSGILRFDESTASGCFTLEGEGVTYFLVWPAGTVWNPGDRTVSLPPDDERLAVDSTVVLGGGELGAGSLPQLLSTESQAGLAQCTPSSGSIAIVSPSS